MKPHMDANAIKEEFANGLQARKDISKNLRGSHFTLGHEGEPMRTINQVNFVKYDVAKSVVKPIGNSNTLRQTHFTMGIQLI